MLLTIKFATNDLMRTRLFKARPRELSGRDSEIPSFQIVTNQPRPVFFVTLAVGVRFVKYLATHQLYLYCCNPAGNHIVQHQLLTVMH